MNFQNIPRQNKTIKAAFRPKLDYFCFFDYEQIEYRLLAYYLAAHLGDVHMAENFKAGKDPHTETARLMLGLSDEHELTDAERQVGKTGNFSIMYAGGKPTIMRQLKCDEHRAAELLEALHASMPGAKALQKEVIETYKSRGYILSIAGRHLKTDPAIAKKHGQSRAESALLNYLIQGGAAELLRNALRKTHAALVEAGVQAHMVNQVHDEINIDAPEAELEIIRELVPAQMGNEKVEEFVPITVSAEISDTTWADKKEWNV